MHHHNLLMIINHSWILTVNAFQKVGLEYRNGGVCYGPCNPSKWEADIWGWLKVRRSALLNHTVNHRPHPGMARCRAMAILSAGYIVFAFVGPHVVLNPPPLLNWWSNVWMDYQCTNGPWWNVCIVSFFIDSWANLSEHYCHVEAAKVIMAHKKIYNLLGFFHIWQWTKVLNQTFCHV